jgi:ABC-type glycerol-3-phosphate transport system substrate-binding protein
MALAAAVWLGGLAGCGRQESTDGAPGADAAGGKLSVVFMTRAAEGGGWPDNHPVIKALSQKFNLDLEMQWVPGANYDEKLAVLVATGNLPDVYFVNSEDFAKWQGSGLFLDVKPFLADEPNLTEYIPEENWKLGNPASKLYGIPHYVPEVRNSLAIRKDWLDKLGLPMPDTIGELYETAKRFVHDDPDGNGENDTVGLLMNIFPGGGFGGIDFLRGAFGLANGWQDAGGKLVPMYTQTAELKALTAYLRKADAEGVLDPDFSVQDWRDPLRKFEAGKSGIAYVNPNNLYVKTIPGLRKIAPDADVVQLTPPIGPAGKRTTITSMSANKLVINSRIDPQKQKRILDLLNYVLSDEGYDLIRNGVEGIHYKKTADGRYVKLPAFDEDRANLFSSWVFRRFDPLVAFQSWDDPQYVSKVMNWVNHLEPYRWPDASAGLQSPTEARMGTTLRQRWTQTLVEVIEGKKPLDAVDQAVAEWKAGGGDKITSEYNADYRNR